MATKLGRPTKYLPQYDDMLIEHMKQGLSYESFSAVVNTCRDTLYDWEVLYPSFLDSKKIAFEHRALTWEKIYISGMTGKIKGFNAACAIFGMKAHQGWKDGSENSVNITKDSDKLVINIGGKKNDIPVSGEADS